MDHKYKSLLQNIPTRHVITAIAKDGEREQQIEKLRNLDINNFFILGTLQSIKLVLGNIDNTIVCPFYEQTEEAPRILINLFRICKKRIFQKELRLARYNPVQG